MSLSLFAKNKCEFLCRNYSAKHHHYFVMRKHSANSVCLPSEKYQADFVTHKIAIMRKVCETLFLSTVGMYIPIGFSVVSQLFFFEQNYL